MKLHLNQTLFETSITVTSQDLGIPEIYIEKDYWVTLALKTIFESDCKAYSVFKGGTALSKCYKVIERFSEDIDLVVLREEAESGNSLTRKIKSIGAVVNEVLPEVEKEGVTSKSGRLRKTAHDYPKVFKGDFGQVRDFIVVEASTLGNFEPYQEMEVSSFIYEMMVARGQQQIAEEQNMLPFIIQVLDIRRTICEKIMSLVRFSYEVDPIDSLKNKIRHTYDIHQLLKIPGINTFFESNEFDQMLLKVGGDDVDSFRNNNDWLPNHPSEALIFKNTHEVWRQLADTYKGSFSDLVYGGNLPKSEEVVASLERVSLRIAKVKWSIELD
ncbi:nucleotidyl transferase AbiEii/AbiGii toxin family protein [Roseivirga sp. UBA838]|uniref:nucleotidyl transferase AbiEii/AbiGii toxin family protein n=1 Tax=Roseivirga sp. UBA838 TaxID=1947393 RepID=UPI00257BC9C5|nr:nucleotidyl transferase AbiEii/AbiGii toxin family protein [Roseivirga sp. UBA838]|tara:strand:- start:1851 stop:2834 length:984 start_codon:yes stop_codon:yes gene_type:complete